MAKMNGVDVSGWQPANVLDLVPFDFAVVKITQGSGASCAIFPLMSGGQLRLNQLPENRLHRLRKLMKKLQPMS